MKRRIGRLVGRLLRVPLFYKILVANAGAVALAAGLGTWLTATHDLGRGGGLSPLGVAALFAAAGVLLSAVLDAVLLRRALAPLDELARVADRLRSEGPDLEIRARIGPTADRKLADLIRVFNGMLETMSRYRAQLRRLAVRTMEEAEAERKVIARRLQEDTAQRLASLIVRTQVLRRTTDPGERERALEALREEAALALESVRRTARDLHPPELEEIGLERALRAFARSLRDGGGAPRIELDVDPVDGELEEAARLALYRILQEAIRNAHRHAGASVVTVEVRRREGPRGREPEWAAGPGAPASEAGDAILEAEVRDDGLGLPADDGLPGGGGAPAGEGLGLLTMRERARNVGGRLEITGRPGRGTTVRLEIPLSRAPQSSKSSPCPAGSG